jgi:hypothetical protein
MNEMQGSRSKLPSKNLVIQCCAERFNSGVKGLEVINLSGETSTCSIHLVMITFSTLIHILETIITEAKNG